MLPHLACFETAWDDGLCWPNCNNQACGHNDCTWPQMATQCLHEEDLMMRDASTPPLHPNVALSIDGAGLPGLGPDKETSLHVYSISLSYRLTWHDARLANSPCASTLEGMLSSTDGTEPSIYRRRFWVPDVKALNGIKGSNDAAGTGTVLIDAVGNANASFTRLQHFEQNFDFTYYPFDHHEIRLEMQVPTSILSCEVMADCLEEQALRDLLPLASPWRRAQAPIRAEPLCPGGHSGCDASRCVVLIPIVRDAQVFIFQRLIPQVVICQGAMLALKMNPLNPPLVGARFSVLVFAMVLVTLKSSDASADLGKLNTLVWVDILRLLQFFILLVALLASSAVHYYIRQDEQAFALHIDSIAQTMLPLVLYPFYIICLLLAGFQHVTLAAVLGIVGTLVMGTMSFVLVLRGADQLAARQHEVASQLATADLSDESNVPLLREAFDLFNVEPGDNGLDRKELNTLFVELFPHLKRSQRVDLVKQMNLEMNVVLFDDFVYAMQTHYPTLKREHFGGAHASKAKSNSLISSMFSVRMSRKSRATVAVASYAPAAAGGVDTEDDGNNAGAKVAP